MHPEVLEYVGQWATTHPVRVLDIGGRDVNGTCRRFFPNADYTSLDLKDGPSVDIVTDAADWTPDRQYDLILCTEVFEHTQRWPEICATAYKALAPAGRFIVTCAGPGRQIHSGVDGVPDLQPGEFYENVNAPKLAQVLADVGFIEIVTIQLQQDTQATAVR